jgi:dTDP-glucose 4,6-dehydratase
MRILVTGGLGTIGAGLVAELRRRGHYVVSCDLYHQPDEVGFSLRTDVAQPLYARCDVSEFRQLERVFERLGPFDYVYHCAAEFGRWNGEDFYETLWRTNCIGTKNVIRLQEQRGFRLIHFSSSEVYGDWPDLMIETVMEEYEVKQLNDYAMTKWVNEMQVRNSRQQYGTETVVVRLFNTYGPGEYYSPYRSVNSRFLFCGLRGLSWTVFRGHARTSTYLADTVRTLSNITENFRPGETYNIGGCELHSIEELSDIVLAITGADRKLVQYQDSEILTTLVKRVDVSKSVRDLDHRNSYRLEAGMRLTADWMRDVYRLPRADAAAPAREESQGRLVTVAGQRGILCGTAVGPAD